jgi:hypothetical protein
MARKLFFVYALSICSGVLYSQLTGYEFGNDAASTWSQQGVNRYHK